MTPGPLLARALDYVNAQVGAMLDAINGSGLSRSTVIILSAGLLFAVAFAIPGLAYRYLGLNSVVAFSTSYVMTRPLGASFADWMGKGHNGGGLNWGDASVSFVLLLLIAAFVAFLSLVGDGGRRRQPAAL